MGEIQLVLAAGRPIGSGRKARGSPRFRSRATDSGLHPIDHGRRYRQTI